MAGDEGFRKDELESIGAGLTEFSSGDVPFEHPLLATAALMDIWTLAEPLMREAREAMPHMPRVMREELRVPYPAPPQADWDLGLTHEFRKAIRSIDRKLQGRVLEALDYISTKPTVPVGDTVKPLTGEHKGLWRYRIGDYRLIYRPDTDNARVLLITVVSRGSAYA